MKATTLKPGDIAPVSGLYLIRHKLHLLPERELILRGSRVPACSVCAGAVRYELEAPCIPHRGAGTLAFAAA